MAVVRIGRPLPPKLYYLCAWASAATPPGWWAAASLAPPGSGSLPYSPTALCPATGVSPLRPKGKLTPASRASSTSSRAAGSSGAAGSTTTRRGLFFPTEPPPFPTGYAPEGAKSPRAAVRRARGPGALCRQTALPPGGNFSAPGRDPPPRPPGGAPGGPGALCGQTAVSSGANFSAERRNSPSSRRDSRPTSFSGSSRMSPANQPIMTPAMAYM